MPLNHMLVEMSHIATSVTDNANILCLQSVMSNLSWQNRTHSQAFVSTHSNYNINSKQTALNIGQTIGTANLKQMQTGKIRKTGNPFQWTCLSVDMLEQKKPLIHLLRSNQTINQESKRSCQ